MYKRQILLEGKEIRKMPTKELAQKISILSQHQITPDDISDDGPIAPASANGTPSRQQIEQDVVAVNPSVDSMESRG